MQKVLVTSLAPSHYHTWPMPSILTRWYPSSEPCTLRCLVNRLVTDPRVVGQCSMIPNLPLSSCSTCCMRGEGVHDPRPIVHCGHRCSQLGEYESILFNHPQKHFWPVTLVQDDAHVPGGSSLMYMQAQRSHMYVLVGEPAPGGLLTHVVHLLTLWAFNHLI